VQNPKLTRRAMLRRTSFLLISLLSACPKSVEHAPEETCAKVGQTCKLDKGLLGVCTAGTTDCDGAPCLVCMGQH
jgi:hypothetical protein